MFIEIGFRDNFEIYLVHLVYTESAIKQGRGKVGGRRTRRPWPENQPKSRRRGMKWRRLR